MLRIGDLGSTCSRTLPVCAAVSSSGLKGADHLYCRLSPTSTTPGLPSGMVARNYQQRAQRKLCRGLWETLLQRKLPGGGPEATCRKMNWAPWAAGDLQDDRERATLLTHS